MPIQYPLLLHLLLFSLLSSLSTADDAAVMSKLLAALSPAPPRWDNKHPFCQWTNVRCDFTNKFVTSISLDSKSLSGTLPAELSQLSSLQSLSLQKNSLSGALPSFANLTSLENIYLDSNSFSSIPPDFLLGCSNLQVISISENYNLAPWKIPLYLTGSSNLQSFYASNSSIVGEIPDFFDSFPNLKGLRLSYNNITGGLPASLGRSEVQNIWLNNQLQKLSGPIDVLSSMTQIYQVWLFANAFNGPIPDMSNCTNLFDLQLRDNQFTGVVPPSLMNLPNLVNISLSNNKLQGPLPVFKAGVQVTLGTTNSFCGTTSGPCDPQVTALLAVAGALGYPMVLAQSWEGNNSCSGDWTFITCDPQMKNVITVNFGKQRFSGTISPAFANLTSLRNLYLNDNSLTGSIPEILTSLPQLQNFDVSNNNLTGPRLVFPRGVKFTYTGNLLLEKNQTTGGNGTSGGTPGHGSNSGTHSGNTTGSGSSKRSSVSAEMIAGVVIAVLLCVVVLFVSYKYYTKRRHQRLVNVAINIFEGENVAIPIQILRQVTNNFSEDNILGRGGFGVVYKGELHDATKIAVKRMESGAMGTKGMKAFQSEIAVLTKVRHKHLVALLGYCVDGNERLLIYEYMPQGTLAQHLFEWQELAYPPLTWKQRVTIALDVGRGVEYLHSLAQQRFIHRDLKPANILLGDDMRAKVADFGLVRKAPDGKYSVETRLAGTFGYLPPEYGTTGRVTTKADVYAFGVVLMEIITGRKALDETLSDELHLVTWFHRVLINKDNIREAIDSNLDTDEETYESICKVAELAGHCTARQPHQRPDMGHVVNVLGPLVEQWEPAKSQEGESCSIDLHQVGTSTTFDDISAELNSETAPVVFKRTNYAPQPYSTF